MSRLAVGGTVIELIIAACLATGECRENRLTYDANDVSLMTCMVAGQAEVARWQQEHPKWRIKRWRCGVARQDGWLLGTEPHDDVRRGKFDSPVTFILCGTNVIRGGF